MTMHGKIKANREFNRKTSHKDILTNILYGNEKKIDKNIKKTMKHVISHIMKLSSDLSTRGPLIRIVFTKVDEDEFFKEIGFHRKELEKALSNCKIIDKKRITQNNPFLILLVVLIHYFNKKKVKIGKFEVHQILSLYFTLRIYKIAMSASFPHYQPNESVMNYTIDNLKSNKYNIKKFGTMYKTMEFYAESSLENFQDVISSDYDEHLLYFMTNQYGRIKQMMKTIAQEYYKNIDEGNREVVDTLESEDEEGETYLNENESISSLIETHSRRIFLKFVSDTVARQHLLRTACKKTSVSVSKSTIIINKLHSDNNPKIKELIVEILTLHYMENGKSIRSAKFIAKMLNVYKQSNNNNVQISNIKKILNELLTEYSKDYRKTNNVGTLNNFRRMLFIYIILFMVDAS